MSSLTFGPEWLRALSGGTEPEAQAKPVTMKRFKLAEFRYSKEDMLALFDDNFKMPKELEEFGDAIMQKTQIQPLSFIPLSKDEERIQVAGVNSAIVLRMTGRGTPVRGRGAIRGARGRGRGESQQGFYRTLSNEEGGFSNSRDPYPRRPWTEGARGGTSERVAGRGEPPGGRGGFEVRGRIASDRSGSTERDAWRGNQEEDDGGGWRVSGQRSWRKGSADASRNWRTDPVKDEGGEQQNKRTWNRAGGDREDGGTFWRQSSSSSNSGLPEWCDNDIDQDVGTFDASGQFKSLKSIEDSNSQYDRRDSDPPVFDAVKDRKSQGKTGGAGQMEGVQQPEVFYNELDKKSLHNREKRLANSVNGTLRDAPSKESCGESYAEDRASFKSPTIREKQIGSSRVSVEEQHLKYSLPQNDNILNSVNRKTAQNDAELTMDDVRSVADGMHKILAASRTQPSHRGNDDEVANHNIDHIKSLIEKLDDEIDNINPTKLLSAPTQSADDCNIADPSIVCAKKAEPGVGIKGMQDWIYRDQQGEIQGPFSSEEMLQWLNGGYFTLDLPVRRVCDEIFLPLGDLLNVWGRVPFQPGPELPSITSQRHAAHLARRQEEEGYQRFRIQQQQQRKMQHHAQHHQQHQLQPQPHLQHHDLRILQQMKEPQQQHQLNDMQQRPQNLNVSQEVSIWGENPASPNLVSTPWTPTSSQQEKLPWNHSKSPTAGVEDLQMQEEILKEDLQMQVLDTSEKIKSSVSEQKGSCEDEAVSKSGFSDLQGSVRHSRNEEQLDIDENGGLSKKEEEEGPGEGEPKRKNRENKKKKQDGDKKKKDEREKQHKRDDEERKSIEALEKQQQKKLVMQKKKEDEERQQQQQQQAKIEMQHRHMKQLQQQQQQHLQQQQQQQIMQQQQQQQVKQYQMFLQQKQRHEQTLMQQQDQRRQNVSEAPSWNVPVTSNAPSLAEIQRMEEERQMIMRERMKQLQAHEQHLQQQRAGTGWSDKSGQPVTSLRQIQEEEARKLQAMQRNQQNHQPKPVHTLTNSSVWNSKQNMNYGPYESQMNSSFWDDVMNRGPSLQTASHYHQMNQKSRVVSDSAFPSLNATGKQNKKSKEEELVHRIFQQTNPCDEFVQWVNINMPEISKYVDVPTFVTFLQDIDSPYEIHEYIRSYFGDSQDTQAFAKEFLEWKRRNEKHQSQQFAPVGANLDMSGKNDIMYGDADDANAKKKKQKKRMQKVNPSLLGFSCNASPDMVNRGEIQSAMDAWKAK